MGIPGLSIAEQWSNGFYGSYKQHSIIIERDHPGRVWYIQVTAPTGLMTYDGYWPHSEGTDLRDAIMEALKGSELLTQ